MKYRAKRALIWAGCIVLIVGAFWLAGRYGWRIAGFSACGGSGIEVVDAAPGSVTVKGFYPGSFPSGCVGYLAKQEGDRLYLGVRYDPLFGMFEKGEFEAVIPTEGEVSEILLKTGSYEYTVWQRIENGVPAEEETPAE